MPVPFWHPRANAYSIVWSCRNGSHAAPYALIVWRGPGRFEVRMGGIVRGEFPTGDEAAAWAWETHLREHAASPERPPNGHR